MSEEIDNGEEDTGARIPGYESFSQYITEGYKLITGGVKSSMSLPSGRNYLFYQTYTNFRDKMKEKCNDIQTMMEDILTNEGVKGSVRDIMLEDAMDTMVSLNDKMLDRASRYMDLMEGIKTGLGELVKENEVSGSWNRPKKNLDKIKNFTLNIKKNVPRPQFTFKDKVDNSNTVWEPKIRDKPNAIKPLAILVERNDDGDECFSHPYEYELEMFNVPEKQLERIKKPERPLPLESTPYQFIDKEEQLEPLIQYLDQQSEFAVDLEHHSYRSFLGFTCLIQISTREKDIVVDALSLRHCLYKLNLVFTKPTILKIFHGADSDIIWLQRDFGVYVVNMFDTHQAAKLLNFPKLSLAYLLNAYCKVDANKHFQLFDWRTRPIPDDALTYAREDTHYLIYISEVMRNQLIDKGNGQTNILKAVYHQSKLVCLKRFEKLVVDEDTYLNVYRKGKRFFDNRQLFALKALYLWRDKTAREFDESLSYVLPDNMMLNIAENLPREVQGILACCNPVPPLVKANLFEIHYLVVKAKEQPLVKVITESQVQVSSMKTSDVSAEQQMLEQWFYPPSEVRHDVPTLLGDTIVQDEVVTYQPDVKPHLNIFDKKNTKWYNMSDNENVDIDNEVLNKLKGLNFMSPYERYVKVLPYSAQLEKERKQLEMKEAEEHRLRSRQQQALAMEIKSLEESGLIKLNKEDEVKETLKLQVINERKRRANENSGLSKHARKLARRQNRAAIDSATSIDNDDVSETQRDISEIKHEIKDEKDKDLSLTSLGKSNVKSEDDTETVTSISDPGQPNKGIEWNRPTNWKELRKQKGPIGGSTGGSSFKPYDYSKVNYSEKFSSGTIRNNDKSCKQKQHHVLDKKKKWINNVGARKFSAKKKKRANIA